MDTMTYKGYIGAVEYDDTVQRFHGRVINIRDTITFEGRSVDELQQALKDSVEAYLEMCAEDKIEPNTPFSGKFVVRLDPELHRDVVVAATRAHKSLNAFVKEALVEHVGVPALDSVDITVSYPSLRKRKKTHSRHQR